MVSRIFVLMYLAVLCSFSSTPCVSQVNSARDLNSQEMPTPSNRSLTPYILLNQRFNEGLHSTIDIGNVDTVFQTIFRSLSRFGVRVPLRRIIITSFFIHMAVVSGETFDLGFTIGIPAVSISSIGNSTMIRKALKCRPGRSSTATRWTLL